MKKLLLASTAIGGIGLAGPALAADLPVKAPPVVAPAVFSWTGCYIGGNVGGARGQKEWDNFGGSLLTRLFGGAIINELVTASGSVSITATASTTSVVGSSTASSTFTRTASTSVSGTFSGTTHALRTTSISDDTAGFLAGGQIGCDFQFSPRWVIGFEADGEWAHITGTVDLPQQTAAFALEGQPNPAGGAPITVAFPGVLTGAISAHTKTEWLAAITARLGYVPWDRWLFYIKGGAAFAGDRYEVSGHTCPVVSLVAAIPSECGDFNLAAKETRFGWTTGLGIEYAFFDGWSAKLEYDHYDFGTKRVTFTDNIGFLRGEAFGTGFADISQRIDVLKFGVNYRFNLGKAPAAVVARY